MKRKFYQLNTKSFEDEKVGNIKELWEKIKGDHAGICMSMNAEFTKAAETDNKFHVVFSSATQDRHWDVVEQNFQLKHFKKNPVLLDSHDYSSITSIVGKVENIKVKDGKLQGDVIFALENPIGLLGYKLAKDGFLNTTSIGFIPLEFDEKTSNIIDSELLEISVVSVPANPEALFEKSIDGENEESESVEEETAGVPAEETAPEPVATSVNKTPVFFRAAKDLGESYRNLIINLAKELQTVKPQNKQEAKRKLYKLIRDL